MTGTCALQPSQIGSTIRHECQDYDWDELDDYGESPLDYCQACQDGVETWQRLSVIIRNAKNEESVDVEPAIVGSAVLPFTEGEIRELKEGDPFMRMMILDPYRGLDRSWFDYDCMWREEQGLPMSWEEGGLPDEGGFTFDTRPCTVGVSQADKAAEMYNDWEEAEEGWPEGTRKRLGRPWVFYRKRNIWVPTSSVFRYSPHAYIKVVEDDGETKQKKKPAAVGTFRECAKRTPNDYRHDGSHGDTFRNMKGPQEGCRGWLPAAAAAESESEDEGEWISTGAKAKTKTNTKDQKKRTPKNRDKKPRDPLERVLRFILEEEKKAAAAAAAAPKLETAEEDSEDDLSCLAFLARKR